ncbi:hypothetical protein [Methylomagnum sp.]
MIGHASLIAILAALLSACASGIPSVDDPLHPVVDGESVPSVQFLQKYCMGENMNATCSEVRNAVAESLQSPSP